MFELVILERSDGGDLVATKSRLGNSTHISISAASLVIKFYYRIISMLAHRASCTCTCGDSPSVAIPPMGGLRQCGSCTLATKLRPLVTSP